MAVGDTPSSSAAEWLACAEKWDAAARCARDQGYHSHAYEQVRHVVEPALKAVLVPRGSEQPTHVTSLLLLIREIGDDLPADLRSAPVKLDHYWYYASYPSELIPRPSEYYEASGPPEDS